MKKIVIYLSIVLVFHIGFTACEDLKFGDDFLEKAPSGDVTLDSIYSKKITAEGHLASAYRTLFYGFPLQWENADNRLFMEMLDALTDMVQGVSARGSGYYYNGAYNAGTEDGDDRGNSKYGFLQERSWSGIRNAYIFINNVDRVPDMTDKEKLVRKAEAKMIIACHYADMLRHFGGLPWLDKPVYPGDDTNYPRLTIEETTNKLCALIDEAATDLPWTLTDVTTDDGRFTRAAALGLKIRVLLFVASPLFNDDVPYMAGEASDRKMTWLGGKDMSWYTQAKDACELFFAELKIKGGYDIVNTGNPRTDYIKGYYARGNGELLISTRRVYMSGDLWDGKYYYYQQHSNYGSSSATLDGVDMFEFKDGTKFDWNNPTHATNPFTLVDGKTLNRDPRLYENVTIQGDRMQNKRLDIFISGSTPKSTNGWLRANIPSTNMWLTGFSLRKFIRERTVGNGYKEVVQWPYLRLPEIYLSYAEILNELGQEDEAYKYIKPVRDRANMPNLNKNGNLGKIALRQEILLERAREFMYEEVRWYDIIRWKQEDVFKKRLRGLKITCTNKTANPSDKTPNLSLTFEPYDLATDRAWRTNFSPKWYLSAFPPSEINKDYGLVQNPGW